MSTRPGTPASLAGTDVSATAATAGISCDLAALSLGNHRPNSHTRRKSESHVNRPPNGFVVFRRAQVQCMPTNVIQHQQRISNLTALFWCVLTHSEQNTWYSLADDIKCLRNIFFPDYTLTPTTLMAPKGYSAQGWIDAREVRFCVERGAIVDPKAYHHGQDHPPQGSEKGQGTHATERREREAAGREASHQAVARAAAITTATMASNNPLSNEQLSDSDDGLYLSDQFSASGYEHSSTYFAAPAEERCSTPDHESAIAWRPDFSLEGSASSRSSPSNLWSELAPPYGASTATTDSLDPLDVASR
ncbi:hypothetical protein CPB86DRAFT_845696 [Serendipita vermifera]|nr:hypothetical protein CPB86DRAFT_845696 [Serendipita vermifera]